MAVLISINGNSSGEGFLMAPLDSNYNAEISLQTDAGTDSVTIQASPNPAGLVFSTLGPLSLSTTPTTVSVHALMQSTTRNDTVIQVLSGATVVASFNITSIRFPVINFGGRFEARFSTDGAYYNTNPKYLPTGTDPNLPGWTWILEGEPDFVPSTGNVPSNLEDTGVGRVVRLNNPAALRSHVSPVASTVNSISGQTTTGTETFVVGDPLIGQSVNFGPDTYFAGNQPINSADGQPEERFAAQQEPLALFKIDIGNPSLYFRGASQVGPYTGPSAFVGDRTRTPDSRPFPISIASATTELAEVGLTNLVTFSATRIDLLIADYNALPAGPSVQRRNLLRRIEHLLSSVSTAKRNAVQAANPGVFTTRNGTVAWGFKEEFSGKVDADLHALAGGSSVVEYLRQFFSFDVGWTPFGFHSDELCGYHKGTLNGDPTMTGNSIGDPHTRTVDGTRYDFQAVGEFTLLRNGEKMEIQVRQSPVPAQNPIKDNYTGLRSCVSIITAVALRVGSHCISLQPTRGENEGLQFYLDGKPENLTNAGFDLGNHRVSGFDVSGRSGVRVDYDDNTTIIITPKFWSSFNVWYMDVNVSNTKAVEGLMGYIPAKSWLPRLRNGENVGSMPSSLADIYKTLYKTFADSWRITNASSLFVYTSGTTTKTFTDKDWPALEAPCKLKPEFEIPGTGVLEGMPIDKAKEICKAITDGELNANCVFDVATTGDKIFADGYLFEQELRKCGTKIEIIGNETPAFPSRTIKSMDSTPEKKTKISYSLTASVKPLFESKSKPKGKVTFYLNNRAVSEPIEIDLQGRAKWKAEDLKKGVNKLRAVFVPNDEKNCSSSSSPNLVYDIPDIGKREEETDKKGSLGLPWYLWVILIVIIILILLWLM